MSWVWCFGSVSAFDESINYIIADEIHRLAFIFYHFPHSLNVFCWFSFMLSIRQQFLWKIAFWKFHFLNLYFNCKISYSDFGMNRKTTKEKKNVKKQTHTELSCNGLFWFWPNVLDMFVCSKCCKTEMRFPGEVKWSKNEDKLSIFLHFCSLFVALLVECCRMADVRSMSQLSHSDVFLFYHFP